MTLGAFLKTFGPSSCGCLGAMVSMPGKLGGLSQSAGWSSKAKPPWSRPSVAGRDAAFGKI